MSDLEKNPALEQEQEEDVVLEEGDFAVVFKSDGDIKIMVTEGETEEKDQDQLEKAVGLAEYIRFVLDSEECLELFKQHNKEYEAAPGSGSNVLN